MELLSELNEVQREAVLYNDGPSLVIAGAGSGKTRVLTYKIAWLLQNGYAPYRILALTFTNKSAREMKSRIADLVGSDLARNLWMGTFHSVFAKILRLEAQHLDLSSSFSIYDTADSRSCLRALIKEMKLDDKVYKVNYVQYRISGAKNNLLLPQAYAQAASVQEADRYNNMPLIKDIYARYMSRCKQAGALDFDDILLYTNILFRDHPEVLDKYRERFAYILVDEYQDTNASQSLIVNKLAEEHRKICVVGDDAQSIYSFRGARIENILGFKTVFPGYKLFKLEQNYRSTQRIVDVANSLIGKNENQIPKKTFSKNELGEPIKIAQAYSDAEEAFIVANAIAEYRYAGSEFKDMAILYRTNAQSRIFEEAFRKKNMPYKIYGGLSFYQRKEIKDMTAYFRLAVNPHDDEALRRVINYPARGIGMTTLAKLQEAAGVFGQSLWNILLAPLQYNVSVNAGTANKLRSFASMIKDFGAQAKEQDAYTLGHAIAHTTGLLPTLYEDKSPQGVSGCENVEELLNAMQEFVRARREEGEATFLFNFIEEIALVTDQDTDTAEDVQKISLMTIHAAKGLEFKHVFVVGLEEELFPSSMATTEKDIEEERRLFYVAITRAERTCHISFARSRSRFGSSKSCRPSRFLIDLDPQYLEGGVGMRSSGSTGGSYGGYAKERMQRAREVVPVRRNLRPLEQESERQEGQTAEPASCDKIQVGMTVEHSRFGVGRVMSLSGEGPNRKARVLFHNAGQRDLLLKFAQLKIVKK